jgi:hypothetical protein
VLEKPITLARRMGFGYGLWAEPVALAAAPSSGAGALGALGANYGSTLSLRWWSSERMYLAPSLRLGISYTTVPDGGAYYFDDVKGGSFVNGVFAPSLSLGIAAYRGKTTRFLLSGGLSFGYTVREQVTTTQQLDGKSVQQYEAEKTLGASLPFGFALEQLLSSRISIVLGAESPLLSYSSSTLGARAPTRRIGADFASTRLNAAIYFYTD